MYETPMARALLSRRLGLLDRPDFQDWERHFANADRLPEFLALYPSAELDDDCRYLLMELILSSASEVDPIALDDLWPQIEGVLRERPPLHARSVWDWASIDEETGLPLNDFAISPYLQSTMLALPDVFLAPGFAFEPASLAVRFGRFWWRHYDNQNPVARGLKAAFPDRHLRRPEPVSTAMADQVLGREAECWLIVNRGEGDPGGLGLTPSLLWIDPEKEPSETVAHVAWTCWEANRFQDVLAGEEAFLWASAATGAVFARGPDGVDIFAPDVAQRNAIAKRLQGLG